MNRKLTLITVLLAGILIVLGVAVGVQLRHDAARSAREAQVEKEEAAVKAAQQQATARQMPLATAQRGNNLSGKEGWRGKWQKGRRGFFADRRSTGVGQIVQHITAL